MFDMGFTEMMLIGIVALIVIGPEKLPGVARTAGKYFGRLKRFMTSVKADVEQELRADELRQILADQQQELNSLKDSISGAGKDIEEEVSAAGASLAESIDQTPPAAEPVSDTETETVTAVDGDGETSSETGSEPETGAALGDSETSPETGSGPATGAAAGKAKS